MRTVIVNRTAYTLKGFEEWRGDFSEDFQPGDFVEEGIVEEMRDRLPPRSLDYGYLQVGEPHSHVVDETGRCRATYATFTKEAPGVWKYCGHCYADETIDRKSTISTEVTNEIN